MKKNSISIKEVLKTPELYKDEIENLKKISNSLKNNISLGFPNINDLLNKIKSNIRDNKLNDLGI